MTTPVQPITYGGSTYPLPSSALEALRQTDMGLYNCSMFIYSVLQGNLGASWQSTVAGIKSEFGITGNLIPNNGVAQGNPDGYLIGDMLPFNFSPYLDQAQYTYPVLCVYRGKFDNFEHSTTTRAVKGIWHVDWILPALEARKAEKLLSYRTAVQKKLSQALPHGRDGYYLANDTWGANAGIAEVRLIGGDFAMYKLPAQRLATKGSTSPNDLYFPFLEMTFHVTELEGLINTNAFAGVDSGTIQTTDGYQPPLTVEQFIINT